MQESEIVSEIINTRKFSIIFFSIILGGTYISFGLAFELHIPILAIIGLVSFAVIPIILMKRISMFFTRKVKINFYESFFSMNFYSLKNEVELNTENLNYEEVVSCTVNATRNKYSIIYLYLKNARGFKYTFRSLAKEQVAALNEVIYRELKLYNKNIQLRPTFFASKKGTIYIGALGFLLLIIILLHISYSPQTSPLSLIISLSIFLNILGKRKMDIKTYERLNSE